jgi:DNA-binding NarL/FixJ family response regulator
MKMNEIKVVLVDDHDIVRDGLKVLLMNLPDIKVIGEVSTGQELLYFLLTKKPDILLMDITLPKMSGIVITEKITNEYPEIKVIMLTASVNEKSISDSFKAGAMGYLPKNIKPEELINAIREVHNGIEYISKSISKEILGKYLKKSKTIISKQLKNDHELTKRELEIIELFSEGFSYKEVASKLNISYNTVESHKKNIFEKLKINSIVELVKYAIKNGIISI